MKSKSNHGFRLIAVRPTEECDSKYRKILKDKFYLFYNDYKVENDEIIKKSGEELNESEVPIDFFKSSNPNDDLIISISAVVGKNGDGKSSIVELIMRMLNNFAYAAGFKEKQESLKPINKLCAELYYEIDGSLYTIIFDRNRIVWKIPEQEPIIFSLKDSELENNKKKLESAKLKDHFFYTQISNYSLYAYNSKELYGESDQGAWINGVFHKNDGYQTPIVLNPMRTEGNIDINTENDLTKQRLISLFITYASSDSFRWINEKQLAKAFKIKLFEKSKLEESTLYGFFQTYAEEGVGEYFVDKNKVIENVEAYINDIVTATKLLEEHTSKTDETLDVAKIYDSSITLLNTIYEVIKLVDNEILRKYLNVSENLELEIRNIYYSIDRYIGSLRSFINEISKVNPSIISEDLDGKISKVESFFYRDSMISDDRNDEDIPTPLIGHFYFAYLQRIVTVALCEQIWLEKIKAKEINVNEILKDKIIGYIIYKTISIISKYPNYNDIAKSIFTAIDFTTGKENIISLKKNLQDAIDKIWDDAQNEKTHITLKLRQSLNFLYNHPYGNQEYTEGNNVYVNITTFYNKTKKLWHDSNNTPYDYFFPPIFDSDVVLEQLTSKEEDPDSLSDSLFALYDTEKDKALTLLSHLSSGERQQINVVSSIIYHLRNIDSVSDEEPLLTKYKHVNLIFEEIELYFHPEFQRNFLKFLLDHLSNANLKLQSINLCFVTHSPFILSDIPNQNILMLDKGESSSMPFNTLGANIHDMLGSKFMLSYTIGEVVRGKIDDFLKKYSEYRKEYLNGKDYHFLDNNNYKFLLKNLGDGYLKSLLNGYYDEMMKTDTTTLDELIKEKENELKKLKEQREEM